MIGIIMAGGKGLRMDLPEEKLLLKFQKPVILHVVDALKKSKCFSKIIAITSPSSPKTRKLLIENSVDVFDSPGNGYVEDLNLILQQLEEPSFVSSGDLPFLDSEIVKKIVSMYDETKIWITFLVTKGFLESLHISSKFYINYCGHKCHYTGISMVNTKKISKLEKIPENYVILDDKRIAFNLNTKQDYALLGTT